MTDDLCFGVFADKVLQEEVQGAYLLSSAGVGRGAIFKETAFVAYADTLLVEAFYMCSYLVFRTAGMYLAIFRHIVVVAYITPAIAIHMRSSKLSDCEVNA